MNKLLLLIILGIHSFTYAQELKPHSPGVEAVLKKAGKNRTELEQALIHFEKKNDPLKVKAIEFLIANMDIHYSQDYYWADTTGKRLSYHELNYPDFDTAIKAFEELKNDVKGLHPVAFTYRDIDTIKASFLIENVELAFDAWRRSPAKEIPFDAFCEYVLPYRVGSEPLQNWRKTYNDKFKWISDTLKNGEFDAAVVFAALDYRTWFSNLWGSETKEPLPNLGAMQLLLRKKGFCQDIADLQTFTFRSQGVPASFNFIPYWATTANRHFVNSVFDNNMRAIPLDASSIPDLSGKLKREPAKVLRITYSKQPDALASIIPESEIPKGFMRMANYKDITAEYWPVDNVVCPLYPFKKIPPVTYACVFNGGSWKPAWWGTNQGNSVLFKQLCKGAVFLPCFYINGRFISAGNPVAVGYNNKLELKPDQLKKITLNMYEEERYLIFRPGKKYKLYYWDKLWKPCGEQTAKENQQVLEFKDVPGGALYRLVPEYSTGMERPFSFINGVRKWW